MNKIDIIFKCIVLLYRENEIKDTLSDNSKELVRSIVNIFRDNKQKSYGGEATLLDELLDLLINMLNYDDGYDRVNLLSTLRTILRAEDTLYNNIEKYLELDSSVAGMKRSIVNLRIHLNNYYKENELIKLTKKAYFDMTMGRYEGTIQEYMSKYISNAEACLNVTKTKDGAIVDEIDMSDDEELDRVFKKVKSQAGDGRLKTGWKELNDMLKGGFRAGEMVLISALQHNYKSGFCQSLFAQLCMYNKPILMDKTKKPLALFVSLEDDSDVLIKFLYNYLYFSEHNELPDIDDIDTKNLAGYVREKLSMNGFHIKILRVNPSEWTYKSLFNKVLEYEANGYELKILFIDYLSKLPTTGCINDGPMGTALRDMMNRVRNFCNNSARQALVLTPHQLSTDCKQLLRNGISGLDLVKEIAGKGYYEGSKQIDQVVDVEIHQHIAKKGRKFYLTFQRGKRRYPEIVEEAKKYFMLPFPEGSPIPPNINLQGEYIGFPYSEGDAMLTKITNELDL